MKVESYERNINGRKVTCKGYERRVFYEIFFSTLGQRDKFLDLYDEDKDYELIDAKEHDMFYSKHIYLDRIIVRSSSEMRNKMIKELMLKEVKGKEKEKNKKKYFRYGMGVRIFKV